MPLSDNLAHFSWTAETRSAYEVWYTIVNHPHERKAFWFRYSLLALQNRPPEGRLWAIYFEEEENPHEESVLLPQIWTQTFPHSEIQLQPSGGVSFGKEHFFSHHCAQGAFGDIAWKFEWEPALRCKTPVANLWLAKMFSRSFHQTPNSNIRISGTLTKQGQPLIFTTAPAHQGHTYGTKMPLGWVWGHCSAFREAPEACFEALALYKGRSHPHRPRISSFSLHYQGRDYFFNRLVQLFRNRSHAVLPLWLFEGKHPELEIKGQMRLRPAKFAKVAYQAPDRSILFNHNDCLAQIELRLYRPKESQPFQTLTSDHANLEFVFREGSLSDFEPHYPLEPHS
jgi:hypothetical protein